MPEWVPLNAVDEGDDDADPMFPWYPYLFDRGMGFAVDVRFETREQCLSFIRESLLPATLGERD